MVRAMCGVQLKDRKTVRLNVGVGFLELNHTSHGYGKQCLLA